MRNEVQIILMLLAHDGSSPIDVLGTIGASAALAISGIPFDGPVGAVRVGLKDGEFELNPLTETPGERPELDLIVTGTRDGVVMLEAGAAELPDQRMVEAIMWGQDQLQATIDLQERLRELTSKPARQPVILGVDQAAIDTIDERFGSQIRDASRVTEGRGTRRAFQCPAGRYRRCPRRAVRVESHRVGFSRGRIEVRA